MPTTLPPVRPRATDIRPAPQRVITQDAIERTTSILLVEDEPLTAEVFAQALVRDGHHVEIARDGLQALRRLRDHTPTVVVLDMNLPAVSGAEVVRQLRASGHDRLPVIVVSGSSPSHASLDASALQPGRWIEKPVKPRDLVRVVREFADAAP